MILLVYSSTVADSLAYYRLQHVVSGSQSSVCDAITELVSILKVFTVCVCACVRACALASFIGMCVCGVEVFNRHC